MAESFVKRGRLAVAAGGREFCEERKAGSRWQRGWRREEDWLQIADK